ncbi:ABC transporter substrate-binding protein [Primorskyibacter sp. 2E233]|uniref:ABC transporter substrate-binding protein n=1 Tax=Primorskyibacter sp. 2E233 TaxID=3413431 RepID=UPI003BF0B554
MQLWRIPIPLLIMSIAFGVAGCRSDEDAPFRVGLVVWPPYEMAFLAEDLGYYDGHAIELIDYRSPSDFMVVYQTGSLDAVGTTLGYALELQAADPRQEVVLMINHSTGGDAVVAGAPADTMQDLVGRRIGYEASALGGYVLSRALEESGLTKDDVTLVPLDMQNHEAAFQDGRVDAVVTYEPTVTALLGDGHNVVFDSREIPFEILDVLLTPDHLSEDKQRQLQAFVDGWFKAYDYFLENPSDAASRVAERQGMTVDEFLASFDGVELIDHMTNLAWLSGNTPKLTARLEEHAHKMVELGFLNAVPDVSQMANPTYVEAVEE